MVKCHVFFAVQTEFLNIIYTRFGFKGLKETSSEMNIFLQSMIIRNREQRSGSIINVNSHLKCQNI
jgi:hypothetical protein